MATTNNAYIDHRLRLVSACLMSSTTSAIITHPIDTIKVRLQTTVKNVSPPIATYIRSPTTLYKGLFASMMRNGIFVTSKMYTYSTITSYIKDDTFGAKVGAGMTAGLVGAVIGTPFDMATVRIQNNPKKFNGVRDALGGVYRADGVIGLWSGLPYTAGRAMIVTACQFGVFHQMRQVMSRSNRGEWEGFVCAAVTSAIVTAGASNPIDVCKTRVMSAAGRNAPISMGRIIANEGVLALWKGCGASIARQIPLNITRFGLLDVFKGLFNVRE